MTSTAVCVIMQHIFAAISWSVVKLLSLQRPCIQIFNGDIFLWHAEYYKVESELTKNFPDKAVAFRSDKVGATVVYTCENNALVFKGSQALIPIALLPSPG